MSEDAPADSVIKYVSRAGQKLAFALDHFKLDVSGLRCADFGCNVGGFTDCLLRRGATHVFSVDTGYGTLDYTLRQDDRVTVMERTNALHAAAPDEPVDLIVIDLGWTPQRLAIPAALPWLKGAGRLVSLIKPHYEISGDEKRVHLRDGQLEPAIAERVLANVLSEIQTFGVRVVGHVLSPLVGGKSGRKGPGNREFLALLERAE